MKNIYDKIYSQVNNKLIQKNKLNIKKELFDEMNLLQKQYTTEYYWSLNNWVCLPSVIANECQKIYK